MTELMYGFLDWNIVVKFDSLQLNPPNNFGSDSGVSSLKKFG